MNTGQATAIAGFGLETGYQAMLAERIRLELVEARAADDATEEAEKRIETMLRRDFPNVSIDVPFKIKDRLNFDLWSMTARHCAGDSFVVNECC